MKHIILIFLCLWHVANAGDLKPFESDGCSAFPDGTIKQNQLWLGCCVEHDAAYWKGGSYQDRKNADVKLKICVEKIGQPEIAQLMLAGVRVGGSPFIPTTFRWGYGWPYPRGYKTLTDIEIQEVKIQSMKK